MDHTYLRRFLRLAVAAIVLASGEIYAADVVSTWNGTTGNWTDFARWSSKPLFPNNGAVGGGYCHGIPAGAPAANAGNSIG